jgi:hypothetical protein
VIEMPPGRCAHCPVDRASPCAGLEVRRFCELIDPAYAAFNPNYCSLLQQLSAESIAGSPSGRAEDGLDHVLGVAESVSLLRQMKACPHRVVAAGCGCLGLARCALGRGHNQLVSHFDCFACLRARVHESHGRAGLSRETGILE